MEQATEEIMGKVNINGEVGDYGLFLPPNQETSKKPMWAPKDKSFKALQIQTNTQVEFKKKIRPLRVMLVDGSVKMIAIDDSATVRDIADAVGDKIGIKSLEEFSLRKVTQPGMSKAPAWLLDHFTLHDQGILPDETLEYAKKFFFSDDKVDFDDPFTLHLLYIEVQQAIVTGRYPCSKEEAIEFAALQLQITFGDHNPQTHHPGFFDKNTFLPLQYRKDDKKHSFSAIIINQHKKFANMKEQQAKSRYVMKVRQLKTFGITFFECKQRIPGKKEPIPFHIGVTKSKIIKMDPETQKEIKSWTYEQLRRWSQDRGVFTLDFGDWADDYLTLQTSEGEALSALIAGYIDIILKRRIDTDVVFEEDSDEIAEVETLAGDYSYAQYGITSSFSQPYQGQISKPQLRSPGQQASFMAQEPNTMAQSQGEGMPGPSHGANHPALPPSSKVNVVDMGSAIKCARLLAQELGGKKLFTPQTSLGPEEWGGVMKDSRQQIIGKMTDLFMQAKLKPYDLTRNDLDNRAKDITGDLKNLAAATGALTDLDDSNSPLMDGTKAISDAVGDIFQMLVATAEAPNSPEFKHNLEIAEKVWNNAKRLLENPSLASYCDQGSEILMANCIDAIDKNYEKLIDGILDVAKNVPSTQSRQQLQQELAKAQAMRGMAINCLGNLAQQILDPDVNADFLALTDILGTSKLNLCNKTAQCGYNILQSPQLIEYSDAFDTALANLKESAMTAEFRAISGELDIKTPIQELFKACAVMKSNPQKDKLIEGMKAIRKAEFTAVQICKSLTHGTTPEATELIKDLAADLSQSTNQLIAETKVLYNEPGNLQAAGKLKLISGELEKIGQQMLVEVGQACALHNLRYASKASTASLMKLASASSSASSSCKDAQVRAELLASAKRVQASMADLFNTLQQASKDPTNYVYQSQLLEAAREQIPFYSQLCSTTKKAATKIADLNKKQDMNSSSQETTDNLGNLMKAIQDVSDTNGETAIEEALAEFDSSKRDLEAANYFVEQGMLPKTPGQTRDSTQALYNISIDAVKKSMDKLTLASKYGPKLPEAIQHAAGSIGQVVSASQATASTVTDKNTQKQVLGNATQLLEGTLEAITQARILAIDPTNPEKEENYNKARNKVLASLGTVDDTANLIDVKEVNNAIQNIEKEKDSLNKNAPKRMAFKDASDGLSSTNKILVANVTQLTNVAKSNPTNLPQVAKMSANACSQFLQMASVAATSSTDSGMSDQILLQARLLASAMQDLLNSTKDVASKKTPENIKSLSQHNAAAILEAQRMNQLLGQGGAGASPEAAQAIKSIDNLVIQFDNNSIQCRASTRESLLNEFLKAAKDMARVTSGLVSSTRVSASKHGMYSKEASSVIENLIVASKSAFVSDGTTAAMSHEGNTICRASEAICASPKDAKETIENMRKINGAATKLIATAKERSQNEQNKVKKATIVANVQNVVNALNGLTQTARSVVVSQPQTVQALSKAASDLKNHVQDLETAMQPELDEEHAEENRVDGAVAQELAEVTRSLALAARDMIGASVGVASNSANVESGKQFEESTKKVASTLSDLIKVTGALNPGVKECENAVEEIERASAKLDAATFDAAAGKLSREGPYQQYQSDASELAKKVSQDIQNLFNAAGGTSSQLKAAALALRESVPQLASRIEDTASTAPELEIQTTLLNTTKQLADNVVKLIRNSQNINLSDKEAVAKIIALSSQSQEDVGILLGSLSSGADLPQDIDREVNSIIVALQSLGQPIAPSSNYSECREQLAASTKEAVKAITHFFNVDKRNVGQVSLAAARIGEVMTKLVTNARVSSATTKENDAKRGLLESTKQLGVATMYLLQDVKNMSLGQDIGQKFEKDFQAVNQATSTLLAASKKGAVGEVLIEQAIKGINQQITNLNTAGIFAQAGQLEQAKQTPMSDFQNQITTDCNKLQECAKNIARIAQSASGSDEDLGNSAVMLEKIIAQIAQLSMASASKLQDSRSQQSLLSAAKLLGISNHQFILSANDVQRIRDDSTAKQTLTTSLASVGDHVSNLVTVMNEVAEADARGDSELNISIDAIRKLIKSALGFGSNTTPDDVLNSCKEMLKVVSKIIYSGTQQEIAEAANESVDTVDKLLNYAKALSKKAPDDKIGQALMLATNKSAELLCNLLELSKLNKNEPANQAKQEKAGEQITEAVNQIVSALRKFPRQMDISLTGKENLDTSAEEELLKCCKIIDESVKKLENFRPVQGKKPGPMDDANNSLIDAASTASKATGYLSQCALHAQKERAAIGKTKGPSYTPDPVLINGLLSAAHGVASSVQGLVGSTNSTIKSKGQNGEEEAIIASANAIASSTNHLFSASRAKADVNSKIQQELQKAIKTVAQATARLVSAAQTYTVLAETAAENDALAGDGGGAVRKELEFQIKILQLEKQLQREKKRQEAIKQAKFQAGL